MCLCGCVYVGTPFKNYAKTQNYVHMIGVTYTDHSPTKFCINCSLQKLHPLENFP